MRLAVGLFAIAVAGMAQQPAAAPQPAQPQRPGQQMQQMQPMQQQMQPMQQQMLQQMQQQMQPVRQQMQQMQQQVQQMRQQMQQMRQMPQQTRMPQMAQPGARNVQPAPARSATARLLNGPAGRWWTNPNLVQRLSITADQQKKLDDVFQQQRLQMIDRNAAVQKESAILEPLAAADQPDEAKIIAQVDKLALARTELEKARVRMALAMRRVLNPDQWKRLNTPQPQPNPVPAAAPVPNPPAPPNAQPANPPAR